MSNLKEMQPLIDRMIDDAGHIDRLPDFRVKDYELCMNIESTKYTIRCVNTGKGIRERVKKLQKEIKRNPLSETAQKVRAMSKWKPKMHQDKQPLAACVNSFKEEPDNLDTYLALFNDQ